MAHAIRHLIRSYSCWGEQSSSSLRSGGRRASLSRWACKCLLLLFTTACALFLVHGRAEAQAPRPGEQSGRFTVFSARPITDLAFVPRPTAARQKLVFYPTARSPRWEYQSAMPLRFYDESTGGVVAEAVIPPEIREALLVFSTIEPTPKTGLRYRIAVLDDSARRHSPGRLAIVNLSGLALTGTVGRETVSLAAGLNEAVPIAPGTKVVLRTAAKGRAVQAYADTVQLKKNERALLLLFPPFYQGSLEVQSRLLIDGPTPVAPKK